MEISKLNIKTKASKKLQRSILFFLDVDSIIESGNFSNEFLEILHRFKNMSADIFSCSNFFEDLNLSEENYLNKILREIQEIGKHSSLQEFLEAMHNMTKEKLDENFEEKFLTILILLYFFLQESIYGPSFFYIRETEKVDYQRDIHKFNESLFAKIDHILEDETNDKIKSIKKQMIEYLTIAGEIPYSNMKLLIFYVIAYESFLKSSTFDEYFDITKLWRARILFLHNKMMKEPINELKEAIAKNFKEFDLNSILEDKVINEHQSQSDLLFDYNNIIKGMIQLEKSYSSLMYYKYKEAETLIEEARELFKLKISLTGAMGKKTKFQEFETAILVVDSKSSTATVKKDSNSLDDISEEPKIVKLDEDNPLLETPKINDKEKQLSTDDLSLYDQIYVNAFLNCLKKSNPDEDLLREIITAYINKSLGKSNDWVVHSKLLLHKSLAEDKKTKTIERSLLQMQSLCDQHSDRSPMPYNRLRYIFTIDYPFIWNIKKHNAEMFMNYGAVITAFDIFNELSMHEECIQCLYVAGKTQRAVEFAEEILKNKEDPGIYCVLGEILNKEEYFFKALEISNNKYTRAYRCLGKFFFSIKNNLEESIKYYEKAMEINPMFPNIWFTMGCIYLRLSNWQMAIKCFSKSVGLDESSADAWANLGLAFAQVKKLKEAIKCLEEGFKRNRSWKICENLMYVSIDAKDLNKLIFAINNLFMLDQHDRLKPGVYYNLISLFLSSYPNLSQTQRDFFKNQIYNIFENFSIKDGATPEIWDLYALYIESVEIECVKNTISEDDKQIIYRRICDLLLKQGRGLIIEEIWEKNDKMVERVSKLVEKLKKNLERVKDPIYKQEVNPFIQNISNKIDKFYKMKEFDKK